MNWLSNKPSGSTADTLEAGNPGAGNPGKGNPGKGNLGKERVPLILQGEANECALACLCMILNSFGAHESLAELRARHSSGQPLSLEQLRHLASTYRLETRALRCDLIDLRQIQIPAILHFDFDHYVVLVRVTARGASIVDPAAGARKISQDELSRRFTGVLLEIQPGIGFQQYGSAKSYSAIRFLSRLPVRTLAKPLSLLLGLSACIQIFALLAPLYVQIVIDEALLTNNIELIHIVSIGFGLLYLTSSVTQWFRGLLLIHVGNQLSYSLAAWLFDHLLTLPVKFFERRTIGDIVSRFTSLRPLQEFVTSSAVSLLIDSVMASVTFIMLYCYSPRITIVVSALLILSSVIQFLLFKPLRARTHEAVIKDASVQSHFIETVRSVATIKRFDAEERRDNEWLNKLVNSINAEVKTSRIQLLFELTRFLTSSATIILVVYIAAQEIVIGTMSLGMLYALVAYTNHLSSAFLSITHEWQSFLMLSLHVQRISDIVETRTDSKPRLMASDGDTEGISIRKLSFAFPGCSRPIIHQFDLTIATNEKVAILGPSGSGKSTLLRLIMGEEAPDEGEIFIGKRLLSDQVRSSSLFSSVFQSDHLLSGTLAENISFHDPHPNPERIAKSAALACIHDDILRLPLAYSTRVGEMGTQLSAGQQQRILIARALYRPAPILLLDEGTSHLDRTTEFAVMKNLLAEPGICIFVTHRRNLAELADQVISLGVIVDDSMPHQALKHCEPG